MSNEIEQRLLARAMLWDATVQANTPGDLINPDGPAALAVIARLKGDVEDQTNCRLRSEEYGIAADAEIARLNASIDELHASTEAFRHAWEASEARIDELVAGLEPFSRLLKRDDPRTSDAAMVVVQYGFTKMYGLSLRDLRRARAALTPSTNGEAK